MSSSCSRPRERRLRLAALVVGMLLASGAEAPGMEARLRWIPGAGDLPAGYRVWVRTASGEYGPPVDAGTASDAEGGVTFIVGGLDPEGAYTFSVSAYAAGGEQTTRSNEITVPAQRGPCAGRSEGAACATADPCAVGVCRDGSCDAGAGSFSDGVPPLVRLVLRGRVVKGRGRIPGLGGLDPGSAGFDLQVARQDGTPLHAEVVPGASFRVRRRRTVFRYRRPGRLRLVLRRQGDALDFRLRARLEEQASDWAPPFVFTVRVGLDCASALVACQPAHGTRRCEAN